MKVEPQDRPLPPLDPGRKSRFTLSLLLVVTVAFGVGYFLRNAGTEQAAPVQAPESEFTSLYKRLGIAPLPMNLEREANIQYQSRACSARAGRVRQGSYF
jgi:hypothetical protein